MFTDVSSNSLENFDSFWFENISNIMFKLALLAFLSFACISKSGKNIKTYDMTIKSLLSGNKNYSFANKLANSKNLLNDLEFIKQTLLSKVLKLFDLVIAVKKALPKMQQLAQKLIRTHFKISNFTRNLTINNKNKWKTRMAHKIIKRYADRYNDLVEELNEIDKILNKIENKLKKETVRIIEEIDDDFLLYNKERLDHGLSQNPETQLHQNQIVPTITENKLFNELGSNDMPNKPRNLGMVAGKPIPSYLLISNNDSPAADKINVKKHIREDALNKRKEYVLKELRNKRNWLDKMIEEINRKPQLTLH